jgi:hypothetical protein
MMDHVGEILLASVAGVSIVLLLVLIIVAIVRW